MGTKKRSCIIAAALACAISLYGTTRVEHETQGRAAPPPESRIDINSATVEDLLRVPGMTRTWAGRIVRFRPYHSKDEMVLRGVVSSDAYNRIKDYVIARREKQ